MLRLSHRDRQPELMDDPELDEARHDIALRGLARLNALSGSARVTWRPIFQLAQQLQLDSLRVLDIATGSGDVPLRLEKRARRSGLRLEIVGLDVSQRAIDIARQQSLDKHSSVQFQVFDVLTNELPPGFDVVMCSLFLHHLENPQAIHLLRQMDAAARRLGLVNDLVRSNTNLMLVHLATRLVTRSNIVRIDGPRSVKAAFTPAELSQLAAEAGIKNAVVRRRWPCRMLLQWRK